MPVDPAWSDFTEDAFRGHLRALKAGGYRFIRFGEAARGRQVLWRHDVDFSMHRAARLAAIEAEEGAVATYFINPRCTFYNLAEPEVAALAHGMRERGHELGLHFDAGAYPCAQWSLADLVEAVDRERRLLELILGAPVRVMSWHNPDVSNLLDFKADELCGLVNAYGETCRRDFVYASDSNGYWRFTPMAGVIAEGHERLHLLTHPAWWTPQPLSPSQRIDRCIEGRAAAVRRTYDALLLAGGRENQGRD
jgi:hypothetical protein